MIGFLKIICLFATFGDELRFSSLMKKALSILFASLVLLSGTHFTISKHYCGSEGASFEKVSVSGELASCGMENTGDDASLQGIHFSTHCCDNEVSVLAVDPNYAPSFTFFKPFPQPVLQLVDIPASFSFLPLYPVNYIGTNVSPPGHFLVSDVSLPDICVFRI